MTHVHCPRCRLRLNATLHSITSTDAQECPRCWGRDRIEVPMAFYGVRSSALRFLITGQRG